MLAVAALAASIIVHDVETANVAQAPRRRAEATVERPIPPELATGVRWLLAWYASRPILRALVRYLPFGAGSALDVALIAAGQTVLVERRRDD